MKVFPLQNAVASDTAALLEQIFNSNGTRIVADARTNSVIVNADADTLQKIEALLQVLDKDDPRPDAGDSTNATSPMDSQTSGDAPARSKPPAQKQQLKTTADVNQLRRNYEQHEQATAEIANQIRSQKQDKARLARDRKRLEQAVQAAFDARQKLLQAELETLQSRITESRRAIDLRTKVQQQIVERRIEDLLNPQLQWDQESPARSSLPHATLTKPAQGQPASSNQLAPFLNGGVWKPKAGGVVGLHLVIDGGHAALIQGDRLMRLWQVTSNGDPLKPQLRFEPLDGQAAVEGEYDSASRAISLKGTNENGILYDNWTYMDSVSEVWAEKIRIAVAAPEMVSTDLTPRQPDPGQADDGKSRDGTGMPKTPAGVWQLETEPDSPETGTQLVILDGRAALIKDDQVLRMFTAAFTGSRKRWNKVALEQKDGGNSLTGDVEQDRILLREQGTTRDVTYRLQSTEVPATSADLIRNWAAPVLLRGVWTSEQSADQLVFVDGRAALFRNNEISRLWKATSIFTPGREDLALHALDGQASIKGEYYPSISTIHLVMTGDSGLNVLPFKLATSLVPDEWAAAMKSAETKATPASVSRDAAAADQTAGSLPAGKTVVAINVEEKKLAVRGIQVDDFVDVQVTFVDPYAGSSEPTIATLVERAKVFAISDSPPGQLIVDGRPTSYRQVTLVVSPDEAKALQLAEPRGELSLVLRKPEDSERRLSAYDQGKVLQKLESIKVDPAARSAGNDADSIWDQLAKLTGERAKLLLKVTRDHPQVQRLDAQIAALLALTNRSGPTVSPGGERRLPFDYIQALQSLGDKPEAARALRAEYDQQLAAAEADVAAAESERAVAANDVERQTKLVEKGAVNNAELDKANGRLKKAEAELQKHQQRLKLFQESRERIVPKQNADGAAVPDPRGNAEADRTVTPPMN